MPQVFILQNQHDQFLTKQKDWISSGDSKTLFRSELKDELINEKVELTVKNPDLRLRVVAADMQTNGRMFIDGSECVSKPASRELEKEVDLHRDNNSRGCEPQDDEIHVSHSNNAELEFSGTHN